MSTRSVMTAVSGNQSFSVYKHHDGYPSGMAEALLAALPYAWELPRWEPDDFAAAFVRGNKKEGGGSIYFTRGHRHHGDLEFSYDVTENGSGGITVTAYKHKWTAKKNDRDPKAIFHGSLADFVTFAEKSGA